LEFSVGIYPVRHDTQSVKATVVNPKILRYGRPRRERDAAIDCDIVEDEVPQEHRDDENGRKQKGQLCSVAIAFSSEVSDDLVA
jgi:hypothetical protein